MKAWRRSVPEGDHHCHGEYLNSNNNIVVNYKQCNLYLSKIWVIDHRRYRDWLNEEDARHQRKEKRVYPKQNLAGAEPKRRQRHSVRLTRNHHEASLTPVCVRHLIPRMAERTRQASDSSRHRAQAKQWHHRDRSLALLMMLVPDKIFFWISWILNSFSWWKCFSSSGTSKLWSAGPIRIPLVRASAWNADSLFSRILVGTENWSVPYNTKNKDKTIVFKNVLRQRFRLYLVFPWPVSLCLLH